MRAVDTNVLVRLITQDDAPQSSAAREFIRNGAWVSHVALAEIVRVLISVYDRSPEEIADSVQILLNQRELTLQDADVVAAALASFTQRPTVGFSDHLLLEIARKAGHLPLGTFDGRLGKIDGAEKIPV